MTIELYYLLLIGIFAASMRVPFIVGVNTAPKGSLEKDPSDFTRPISPSLHRPWVHRAYRAHLNLLEQSMPFGMVVLVAHVTGVTSHTIVASCVAFVILRLLHAVGMITGRAGFPTRPIIFTLAWLCVVLIGIEVVRLA